MKGFRPDALAGNGRQRRPALFWLALFVLVAQAAGFSHSVFSTHVRCEHGDWIEADDVQGSSPSASAFTTVDGARSGISAAALEATRSHQHCAVLAQQRQPLSQHPELAPEPALLSRPASTTESVPCSRVTALFRLAPKQSPPA